MSVDVGVDSGGSERGRGALALRLASALEVEDGEQAAPARHGLMARSFWCASPSTDRRSAQVVSLAERRSTRGAQRGR